MLDLSNAPMRHHEPVIPAERCGYRLYSNLKADPLNFFTRVMNNEGDFAWMNVAGRRIVMLNDATGIGHVLQRNSDNYFKGHFQQMMRPLFGTSLLIHEGEVWRKRRQAAAPVFANGNFDSHVHHMVAAVEAMFKRWDVSIAMGEPIDVTLEMTKFTLDALLRALFHEATGEIAAELRSGLGVMLEDVEKRIWSIFQLPKFVAHNLPRYQKAKLLTRKIARELIDVRRANGAYPDDLLSRLIGAFGNSEEEQRSLCDEVRAYVLAGHETTAHGLAWTLYTVSKYPFIRNKIEAEISSVMGNAKPDFNMTKQLAYTRQVLDEVFRLFPPVWTMSREAINDDHIPLDNGKFLDVAARDTVMMCHYAVHRREKYWPDPEAFDPERFSPEAMQSRPAFAWFPFGGGPRLCLGFRFAQIESAIALAMIHQRYSYSLVSGQNIEAEPIITLRPKNPILFKMKRRESFVLSPQPEIIAQPVMTKESPVLAQAAACPFHKLTNAVRHKSAS